MLSDWLVTARVTRRDTGVERKAIKVRAADRDQAMRVAFDQLEGPDAVLVTLCTIMPAAADWNPSAAVDL